MDLDIHNNVEKTPPPPLYPQIPPFVNSAPIQYIPPAPPSYETYTAAIQLPYPTTILNAEPEQQPAPDTRNPQPLPDAKLGFSTTCSIFYCFRNT